MWAVRVIRYLRVARALRREGAGSTSVARLVAAVAAMLLAVPLLFMVSVVAVLGGNAQAVAKACAAADGSPGRAEVSKGIAFRGSGVFTATAYGPPWNSMEGYGTTATGIRLPADPTGRPGPYLVAVDPDVVPLHSKLYIWPNPFDYRGAFQAEDTGGAIQGERLDFLDMMGRTHQNSWGVRAVRVSGKPLTGSAMTLNEAAGSEVIGELDCAGLEGSGGPLPLTPGERARLLPNGLAAAPQDAPDFVKRVIAWGNEIVGKEYRYGGGHDRPLSAIAPNYDCASSVGHALFGGGLVGPIPQTSGEMAASFGAPGYGRWISILANRSHVYMYVGGLRWDTHLYGSGDRGNAGIGWHTATRPDIGFTPRHPFTS